MYKRHSIWDEDKLDIHSNKSTYAGQSSGSKDSTHDYHKTDTTYGSSHNQEKKMADSYGSSHKEEDKEKDEKDKEENEEEKSLEKDLNDIEEDYFYEDVEYQIDDKIFLFHMILYGLLEIKPKKFKSKEEKSKFFEMIKEIEISINDLMNYAFEE